jgi:hypothetical protein
VKRENLIWVVIVSAAAVTTTVWWVTANRQASPLESVKNVRPPLESTPLVRTSPASKHQTERKAEALREALTTLNHQPIEFYGRVVDQYDSPISGAMVHGEVIYNTGPTSGVLKPETLTDNSGAFEFRGLQGRTLDLNIVKPGYQFMPEGDGFDYSRLLSEQRRHHPDPGKPVLFKMWKLQGGAALISKTKSFDLPPDGKPVLIDLVTGDMTHRDGDLLITLKHDTAPAERAMTRYDWTAELIAVRGGLSEERNRLTNMFEAPIDGYVPSVVINMPLSANDWSRTYTRNFYLRTRGNIHSRVGIDIHTIPSGGSSYVSLTWSLNPKPGSRTLESLEEAAAK